MWLTISTASRILQLIEWDRERKEQGNRQNSQLEVGYLRGPDMMGDGRQTVARVEGTLVAADGSLSNPLPVCAQTTIRHKSRKKSTIKKHR